LVGILDVAEDDDLMISCKSGITIRTSTGSIREAGRNTQGVKLIRLDENDEIAAITKLDKLEEENEELAGDEGSADLPQAPETSEETGIELDNSDEKEKE
jgi:DNA gyrase subunit A